MTTTNTSMPYIETDCPLVYLHREAGALTVREVAAIAPAICLAYLGDNDQLTDWHGNVVGTYRITRSWRTGPYHTQVYQVYACVGGVWYQGRSQGKSMVFRGKKTTQPRF